MRPYLVHVETRERQANGNYYRTYRLLAASSREAVAKIKNSTGKVGRAYLERS